MLTFKTRLSHLYYKAIKGKTTWENCPVSCRSWTKLFPPFKWAMDLRMIPVRQLFPVFPKLSGTSLNYWGKKLNCILSGADTEIDKQMGEELIDALTHLLRNAIDHGLEDMENSKNRGKIRPAILPWARQEGSQIVIGVTDDGRGLNLEKIKKSPCQRINLENSNLSQRGTNTPDLFPPGFPPPTKGERTLRTGCWDGCC